MSNVKYQIIICISVPSTFSAVMLITNMGWDLQLTNRDSDLFQLLSREIEQNVVTIFQPGPGLAVKMIQFSGQEAGVEAKVIIKGEEREKTSHHWSGEMIRERLVATIKDKNGQVLS